MLNNVKINDKGTLVKVAQYLTNYTERKMASETFSQSFQSYIKSWQSLHGIASTGEVDEATWRAIASSLPTCSTSKNTKSSYTCGLQLLLGGLTADGVYGKNTKNAVAAYQISTGLKADGICGPKTWSSLILGENADVPTTPPTVSTINKQPVDYKQYDSKWKNIKYSTHTSSQTIGNSGCGPTAMADIVATWWDKNATPKELCALSVANGYRTYDSGTAWGFFEFCAKKYKAAKFLPTTSIATLKSALSEGAYAIVSFRPSKWTKAGEL